MALKTAETNYFRLFVCDDFPSISAAVTDWTSNMDDISGATGAEKLATQLLAVNGEQFDQIAGIGLQKDPTLTADPSGFEGNRGIPALKVNAAWKVIDPTNAEWATLLAMDTTRKVIVLVDTQNLLYTDGGLLQLKIKTNQVGNTIEDIEVTGELIDGGIYGTNFRRWKTLFT